VRTFMIGSCDTTNPTDYAETEQVYIIVEVTDALVTRLETLSSLFEGHDILAIETPAGDVALRDGLDCWLDVGGVQADLRMSSISQAMDVLGEGLIDDVAFTTVPKPEDARPTRGSFVIGRAGVVWVRVIDDCYVSIIESPMTTLSAMREALKEDGKWSIKLSYSRRKE